MEEKDEYDEVYGKIIALYDFAQKILDTAQDSSVKDKEKHVAAIAPLVQQIEESAETLTREFCRLYERDLNADSVMKARVDSALSKIVVAIEECKRRAAG